MIQLKQYLLLILASVALVACSDSDDDNDSAISAAENSYIRVLHASSDAPKVNVAVDGAEALADVDYLAGSGFLMLPAGTHSISVDAILADSTTTTVIGPAQLDFSADSEYSVVALGNVADGSLAPLILERSKSEFGAGNIRLQVLHASSAAPAVDIYVTQPNADITAVDATLSNVAFGDYSGLIEVAAGDYQVRITLASTKDVVYDSGTLPLETGTDLLLAAVNNTLTGISPVALIAWSNDGTTVISDTNAGSELRVVHASPDAPAVNVLANGATVLTDVPYTAFSDYLNVPQGDYTVQVEPTAAVGTYVIDADVTLTKDVAYTVLAINNVADIAPLVVTDMRRSIATEAGLRLLHASPSAGNVDIYVGVDADISDESPAFTDVAIGQETGRVALNPGDYYVTVTPTGTQSAAIGPLLLSLAAGDVVTAVARDEIGGGLPLGVIVLPRN
ncbi:DUF4397 domain-containing protein [Ferrimonas lipolytica]|uniref:DUF4397 domain-containing protein n=1 Tax=Ferrimonas lipolytica TaxID=2724191 RepID=A0A6H1UAQ1_9GAMM|nr:DUF4397 domain-containing protein [Ferrimonas lipolytica]QIZ76147.1 DUF4397 domain-containing protein [Ferrimonas lipolytica]